MNFNVLLFLKHLILCSVCIYGDKLTEYVQKPVLVRACIDNATHAFIGCVVAEIILHSLKHQITHQQYYALLFVATIVSSLIDLDHFIVAKSLSLRDATHLDRRPFLHNSAICLVALILVILTKCVGSIKWSLFAVMMFIGFTTHHLRDATRRGIWFKVPFHDSNSPAVPYELYLLLVNIIPHLVHYLMQTTFSSVPKMKQIDLV
uniref:Transmembrane protein 267 n=1 Tax=Anopheles minimus TaxID=112268 RepID=A0A182WAN6_9DIPT